MKHKVAALALCPGIARPGVFISLCHSLTRQGTVRCFAKCKTVGKDATQKLITSPHVIELFENSGVIVAVMFDLFTSYG